VQPFRRGLVCKAHRLLHHSNLGLRVTVKKKREDSFRANSQQTSQFRQGSGLVFQVTVLETFQVVPPSLGSGASDSTPPASRSVPPPLNPLLLICYFFAREWTLRPQTLPQRAARDVQRGGRNPVEQPPRRFRGRPVACACDALDGQTPKPGLKTIISG